MPISRLGRTDALRDQLHLRDPLSTAGRLSNTSHCALQYITLGALGSTQLNLDSP